MKVVKIIQTTERVYKIRNQGNNKQKLEKQEIFQIHILPIYQLANQDHVKKLINLKNQRVFLMICLIYPNCQINQIESLQEY